MSFEEKIFKLLKDDWLTQQEPMDYRLDMQTKNIIKLFDQSLTDLVVEERVNYRGICTKTIRKIRERILYPQTDSPGEKISPEPKDHS